MPTSKHKSKTPAPVLDAAWVATLTVRQLQTELTKRGEENRRGNKPQLANYLLKLIEGVASTDTIVVAALEAEQPKDETKEEAEQPTAGERPTKSAAEDPACSRMPEKTNSSSEQTKPSVVLKFKPVKLKSLVTKPLVMSGPQREPTPAQEALEPQHQEPAQDCIQDTVPEPETKGTAAVEESPGVKELAPQQAAAEPETDEEIPSFCQLLGLFAEWPAQYRDLMSALPSVSDQIQIMKQHKLDSKWGLDVLKVLQHADALDNVFVEQFSRNLWNHLPSQQQKLVGFVNPHCFEMGEEKIEHAARNIVQAFPSVEMTIEELHNFTLIFPTFRTNESGGLGHFNLFVVLNMLSLDEVGLDDAAWPVLHWESWCTRVCGCDLLVCLRLPWILCVCRMFSHFVRRR